MTNMTMMAVENDEFSLANTAFFTRTFVRVNSNTLDTQFSGTTTDTGGNFSTIGCQKLFERSFRNAHRRSNIHGRVIGSDIVDIAPLFNSGVE
jgi:hypothetical protein